MAIAMLPTSPNVPHRASLVIQHLRSPGSLSQFSQTSSFALVQQVPSRRSLFLIFFPEIAHAAFYKENPLKISPDPSLLTHLHILSTSSATLFQEKLSLILVSLVLCLFSGN